jgi:hypothetical protein
VVAPTWCSASAEAVGTRVLLDAESGLPVLPAALAPR